MTNTNKKNDEISSYSDEALIGVVEHPKKYSLNSVRNAIQELERRDVEFRRPNEKTIRLTVAEQMAPSNGIRFVAYFIDTVICLLLSIFLFSAMGWMSNHSDDATVTYITSMVTYSVIVGPISNVFIGGNPYVGLVFFAYFFIFDIFGTSIGKMIMGLKVIDINGERASARKLLIRTLCRFIPFDSFSFIRTQWSVGPNPIGHWHDRFSGTYTVKKNTLNSNIKAMMVFGVLLFFSLTNHLYAQQDSDITVEVKGVSFTMKFVEGGTFQMGATSEQSENVLENEKPVYNVALSNYYIAETEVTQALWEAVMGTTIEQQRDKADSLWPVQGKGDDYPIYYVNYYEIVNEFIIELNRLTGKNFYLPTEAEWEYAAKGGKHSNGYQYAGNNSIDNVAWYWKNSGDNYLDYDWDWDWSKMENNNCRVRNVKTKSQNELGLFDMSGNVMEWCSDAWYDYRDGSQTNPKHEGDFGSIRVLRGGSWRHSEKACEVASRINQHPAARNFTIGFRIVLHQ